MPCCDSEECRADIEGKAPGALAAQVDAAAAGWSEHGQSRAERIERAALDLVRAIGFLPYASAGLDEDIVSMVVEAEEALREALEKKR